MIRRRTVILLGVATLAATAAALVAVVDRTAETRSEVEAVRLFPGLQDRAGEVQQVRIARAEGAEAGTVTLLRTEAGWVVKERDQYPARTDLVRKLLFDLGELELIERKTADAGRYDRLELSDLDRKDSRASRVAVVTAGGETLADLFVGKKRESLTGGKPMVYVRRGAESQSYLAEGELDLRGGPVEWLLREVVNIPKDTIDAAVLTSPTGQVLRLERVGGDFKLVGLAEGRKIGSQYTVNNAATVIDKLLFDDVRSSAGLKFDVGEGSAVFTTKDGLTIRLDLAADTAGGDAARPWLRVEVAIAGDAADEARERGEKARALTEGWAYRLSSYDMERLRATAESLTKPAEGS